MLLVTCCLLLLTCYLLLVINYLMGSDGFHGLEGGSSDFPNFQAKYGYEYGCVACVAYIVCVA